MHGQMDGWVSRQLIDAWMDEWMDEWLDGWMDGWIGWMVGCIDGGWMMDG